MTYTTEFPTSKENFHWKLNQQLSYGKSWEQVVGLTHLIPEAPRTSERVKLSFQGKLVKAQIVHTNCQQWRRGDRGEIHGFSTGSRRRLFELINRLAIEGKAVFLTLSFGNDYPDAKTAKNALRAFLERIRRRCEGNEVSAIWRMEFQERGAPHFHLIFFGLPFICKTTIKNWWSEIIGVLDPFTRIEMVHSHKKLVNYVSKYVAKLDKAEVLSGFNSPTYLHAYAQKFDYNIGRQWGIFNRDNLPYAELVELVWPTVKGEFMEFRRAAERFYKPLRNSLSLGFTLYVWDASVWFEMFETIHQPHG